jgi:predicted  nucleic acid-binding Zn-ribbon protein
MGITAPTHKQALLLDLVDCDVSLSRARSAVKNLAESLHIPTLVSATEEIKARRHDVLIETEGVKAELARAESDVQVVEARILRDQERLATTSSAKDAAGLEHEVSSLLNRRSDLEDIELAIMEKLDALTAVMARIDQELKTAETALDVARNEESLESARLAQEIQKLGQARDALVADLPGDLYALYERQRERYGVGASHLRGGISSASGVALTESDLQIVRKAPADQVLMCPDSNAILVRTSESGL